MTLCSDWILEADVELCYTIPATVDPAVVAMSLTVASEIMYGLTGRRFPGSCTETLRPCGNEGDPYGFQPWLWSYPWVPLRYDGAWLNTGPCGCHMRTCGCGGYPSANLGRSDVQTVTAVKVDGVTLGAATYRLDSQQYLTRLDGSKWPCCQDLTKADTEEGTWSVAITYGNPIPEGLKRAAAVLASEFIKQCAGEACRLPQRTTTVTRQGLTIDMIDPQQFLESGRTGIYEIDLAIKAWNPHGLTRPGFVWSPEVSGRAIRT